MAVDRKSKCATVLVYGRNGEKMEALVAEIDGETTQGRIGIILSWGFSVPNLLKAQ